MQIACERYTAVARRRVAPGEAAASSAEVDDDHAGLLDPGRLTALVHAVVLANAEEAPEATPSRASS